MHEIAYTFQHAKVDMTMHLMDESFRQPLRRMWHDCETCTYFGTYPFLFCWIFIENSKPGSWWTARCCWLWQPRSRSHGKTSATTWLICLKCRETWMDCGEKHPQFQNAPKMIMRSAKSTRLQTLRVQLPAWPSWICALALSNWDDALLILICTEQCRKLSVSYICPEDPGNFTGWSDGIWRICGDFCRGRYWRLFLFKNRLIRGCWIILCISSWFWTCWNFAINPCKILSLVPGCRDTFRFLSCAPLHTFTPGKSRGLKEQRMKVGWFVGWF